MREAPLHPQVNFTSLGSLIWNCYLSWVAHHVPPPHEIDDQTASTRSPTLRFKTAVMSPVTRARAGFGASPELGAREGCRPATMGLLRLDESSQKEELVAGKEGSAGTEGGGGAGGNVRVRSLAV